MSDEIKVTKAKKIHEQLCKVLDSHKLKYDRNDEKLSISCGVQGEDLPMSITVEVDAERQLIFLISYIPITVPEEKRIDMAIAVSVTNAKLADGNFDYDIKTGHLFFRMTNSYIESEIGDEVFTYMLICSMRTIDDFNDKFLMLARDLVKIDYFIEDKED